MQNQWKATKMDYLFVKNEAVWNEFQDGILLNSFKLIEQNVFRFILYDSKRSAYLALTNQNASISFDRYGEYSLIQNGTWISGNYFNKSQINISHFFNKRKNLNIYKDPMKVSYIFFIGFNSF